MNCAMCGEQIEYRYIDTVNAKLKNRSLCYTDNFWYEKAELAANEWADHGSVRINGTHYHIGPEEAATPVMHRAGFRGFGGHEFHIRFYDGKEVTSTNLWCQGDIPERWRAILPDNAEFI